MSTALQFDLGIDLAAFAEHPEAFAPSGRNVRVPVGERVRVPGSINGVAVSCEILVHQARLTRLTQLIQERTRDGSERPYNLVTGMLSDVKMDIYVDDRPLHEVLYEIFAEQVGKDHFMDIDTFLGRAADIGFDFKGAGPMMFQHFGASQHGLDEAFEKILDAGGEDITHSISDERRGRIARIVTHPGLNVTSFEVGQADRDQNQRHQGFVDFVDSILSNFVRVYSLRMQVFELEKIVSGITDPVEIEEVRKDISNLRRQARAWANNWAGAQQRLLRVADGQYEPQPIWDPQHVPCGRVGVSLPSFEFVTNPETGEPILSNGKPIPQQVRKPLFDANGQVVLDDHGRPRTEAVYVPYEINLWRAAGAEEVVAPSGTASLVDTTINGAVPTASGWDSDDEVEQY